MVNSCKKGHEFERRVAKILTRVSGIKWWRTQGSGNTAAQSKADLLPTESKSELFFECKHRKDIKLHHIIFWSPNIQEIVAKVAKESKIENKSWVVILNLSQKILALTRRLKGADHVFPNWWFENVNVVAGINSNEGVKYILWEFPKK